MKNKFDLIIFDWGGTLADSTDWIVFCLKKAAAKQGCRILGQQEINDIIGLSIQNALDKLFPEIDLNLREHLIASYSQEFFSKQMTEKDLFTGV